MCSNSAHMLLPAMSRTAADRTMSRPLWPNALPAAARFPALKAPLLCSIGCEAEDKSRNGHAVVCFPARGGVE
jgi:hypothetical protein